MTKLRVVVFSMLVALPFGLLVLRLFWMQVVNAEEYRSRADWVRTWVEVVPTPRGWIRDRNGEVLAAEERCFDVDVVLADFEKPVREKGRLPELDWSRLAAMLDALARLGWDERALDESALAAMLRTRACPKRPVLGTDGTTDIEPDGDRLAAMLKAPGEASLHAESVQLYLKVLRVLDQVSRVVDRRVNVPGKAVSSRDRRNILKQEWRQPYRLWAGLTYDQMAEIALDEERFPGLEIRARTRRTNPLGPLACHIQGAVGLMNEEEYKRREAAGEFRAELGELVTDEEYERLEFRGSFFGDRVGRDGVERIFDDRLAGKRGVERRAKHLLSKKEWVEERFAPSPGQDLRLTIDLRWQRQAEALLAELGGLNGSIVVLDARSGEVLVLASHPGFDVNLLKPPISASQWAALRDDPTKPLLNRAVASAYPLGSIFKVVTGAAAARKGLVTPDTLFPCHGRYDEQRWPGKFACWIGARGGAHGDLNLRDAMARSCNCFFFAAGEKVGIDEIAEVARELGLGVKTGVDLPGEPAGLVPTPGWRRARENRRWSVMDTLNVSIGQGEIQVTPLQAARLMAGVATGRLPRPRLNLDSEAQWDEIGLPADVLSHVRSGLEAVCMEHYGTGHGAGLHAFKAAGKTSTAQAGRDRQHHGWFAGYAPHDSPRFAFAVMVEHSGSGSGIPAHVAAKLLAILMPEYAPATPPQQPVQAPAEVPGRDE